MNYISISLLLLHTFLLHAREEYNFNFRNEVYDENIKTVTLEINNLPTNFPVMAMNSGQYVMLKFDDLLNEERNFYYSNHGEIDIVANHNNQLVFIEVKSRLNLEYGEPEYAITRKKIKQIKKMAELYLFDKEIEEVDCRFDVVAVLLEDKSTPKITHYENAFM